MKATDKPPMPEGKCETCGIKVSVRWVRGEWYTPKQCRSCSLRRAHQEAVNGRGGWRK